MDMTLLWVVALGAGVAGFVQGLAGFGFGLAAMAFWSWSLAPTLAVPLVVFGSLVGQLLGMRSLRRGFELRRSLPFLAGGVLGIPAGVWLLHYVEPAMFKLGVGLVLVVYCPAMLMAARLPRLAAGGRGADAAVGWLGGAMSGFGGLPGPAPTLWCTLRGWPKDSQRAVFQSFNLLMHAVTLAAYFASGLVTREALRLFLVVAPAMLAPTLAGVWLYDRCSDAAFRRVVLGLLAASGAVLVAGGLKSG